MKDRAQPETLRLRAVMPMFTVNDIQASIAWYRDVLGFIIAEEMEREGKLLGARIKAGAMEFLLSQDDFAKGRDRKKGIGLRLYCVTGQDIDQLAAAIRERGGQLTQEPTDQPWGARDFAMVDPDGFNISISTGVS
ncbi:MAG TPA: VOC family protein [Thermoanaerobaculia bacterium]|nr:VOC family protein [Thermoanaerobaculia bacterium]